MARAMNEPLPAAVLSPRAELDAVCDQMARAASPCLPLARAAADGLLSLVALNDPAVPWPAAALGRMVRPVVVIVGDDPGPGLSHGPLAQSLQAAAALVCLGLHPWRGRRAGRLCRHDGGCRPVAPRGAGDFLRPCPGLAPLSRCAWRDDPSSAWDAASGAAGAAMNAREIAARHGLKRMGREWRGACPACGYKSGLTVSEKGGRALWWCASCPGTKRRLGGRCWAMRRRAGPGCRRAGTAPGSPRGGACGRWRRGRGLSPIIDTYWQARGGRMRVPPSAPLLYLADAKHPSGRRLPCMGVLLHDLAGELVALHRTFLAVLCRVAPARLRRSRCG